MKHARSVGPVRMLISGTRYCLGSTVLRPFALLMPRATVSLAAATQFHQVPKYILLVINHWISVDGSIRFKDEKSPFRFTKMSVFRVGVNFLPA